MVLGKITKSHNLSKDIQLNINSGKEESDE